MADIKGGCKNLQQLWTIATEVKWKGEVAEKPDVNFDHARTNRQTNRRLRNYHIFALSSPMLQCLERWQNTIHFLTIRTVGLHFN